MRSCLRPLLFFTILKSFSSSSSAADKLIRFRAAISAAGAAHRRASPETLKPPTRTLNLSSPIPRHVSFLNTILNSLVLDDRLADAQAFFNHMLDYGVAPTNYSYSILIKLHFANHDHTARVDEAYGVIDSMRRSGCKPDAVTYSTLISGLCRLGRIREALGVLDFMEEVNCMPTVRCYTSIVLGYCHQGKIAEARALVDNMPAHGCPPDNVTYTILVDALSKNRNFAEVEKVLEESLEKGWRPDQVTYNIYMNELCKAGRVDEAFRQLDVMELRGLCPTMETLNILFDGLCRDNKVWEAKGLLERSDELDWDVDAAFYNTLMNRFCRLGGWITVMKLLTDMVKKGIQPDTCTFTIVIRSLCEAKKLRKAECIISSEGVGVDVVAYNTLLHGFYKERAFREVWFLNIGKDVVPNKFTYSIMIDSLCEEGKYSEAISYLSSVEDRFLQYLAARLIRRLVWHDKLGKILCLFEQVRLLVPDAFIFDALIRTFCRKGFCRSRDSDKLGFILDKMLILLKLELQR